VDFGELEVVEAGIARVEESGFVTHTSGRGAINFNVYLVIGHLSWTQVVDLKILNRASLVSHCVTYARRDRLHETACERHVKGIS
jgi:hypothetical protein